MPRGIYTRTKPSHRKGKHHSLKSKQKISNALKNKSEDIWKKINMGVEDECWEWSTMSVNNMGYGVFYMDKKMYLAHRIVYEQAYGSIPDGLFVLHSCDNPKCCNPKHLYLGTQKDNMEDKCKRGRQPNGENHYKHKLTGRDILEIRSLCSTGKYYQHELAKMFGVCAPHISDIVGGKTWKQFLRGQ